MQNYVQKGDTVTVVAPYNVNSGGGCKVSNIFGVAGFTALSGAQVEIQTVGVFDIVKDTSTFTQGAYVYWNDTSKQATSTSAGNTKIGVAALTQPSGTDALGGGSGDATVRVRLNPAF